jgi:hypothetical protein
MLAVDVPGGSATVLSPGGTNECPCRVLPTNKSDSPLSRNVLGSGLAVLVGFSELSELLTLAPGVGVCDCGAPRAFSGSRPPATPLIVGICEPGPDDDVISLVAGGSAFEGCCLFFFPKRNDMATGVHRLRRQRWIDSSQPRIRSAIGSREVLGEWKQRVRARAAEGWGRYCGCSKRNGQS